MEGERRAATVQEARTPGGSPGATGALPARSVNPPVAGSLEGILPRRQWLVEDEADLALASRSS